MTAGTQHHERFARSARAVLAVLMAVRSDSTWIEPRRQLIARYKDGYREVAAALEGATDRELDARPAPGKWSAREIVHHLADSEMTSAIRLRLLVAEDNADDSAVRSRSSLRAGFITIGPIATFAARVPGRATVDRRAARCDDRCGLCQGRARTPSTGATASSAGSRFTPSTRTITPIRFARARAALAT